MLASEWASQGGLGIDVHFLVHFLSFSGRPRPRQSSCRPYGSAIFKKWPGPLKGTKKPPKVTPKWSLLGAWGLHVGLPGRFWAEKGGSQKQVIFRCPSGHPSRGEGGTPPHPVGRARVQTAKGTACTITLQRQSGRELSERPSGQEPVFSAFQPESPWNPEI